MLLEISLLAYLFDKLFGELPITHPVVWMGKFIQWFEKLFYQNSILRGGMLVLSLLTTVILFTWGIIILLNLLPNWLNILISALIASMGLATHLLYESVQSVLYADNPRKTLSMLVSRETENMSSHEIYKGCIETWAENLSDGVIAPLFYLMCFGLMGIAIYKTINTLDSMVGYRIPRYEYFGKIAAKLDDIANYLPARITGLLITLLSGQHFRRAWTIMWRDGKKLNSPNAGFPIAAMAGALNITLGGNTVYHGKLYQKPLLGENTTALTAGIVQQALAFRQYFDRFIILSFLIMILSAI